MSIPLPPLRSLRAFEATVRLGGVSAAARALNVTQPAVSQQLRVLETHLGLALLRREGGRMVLTPAGEAYAARLKGAFAEIAAATREVLAREPGDGPLTVSLLATFAQRWLIPRLAGFQSAHPEVEVRLHTANHLEDLWRQDVDLTIAPGDGAGGPGGAGGRAEFLMENEIFPVVSPSLLAARPLGAPADLADHVLLQVEAPPRADDWQNWLDAAGVPALAPRGRLTFESSSHALEAAVAGLGVAIGHTPFVVDALTTGSLAAPLDLSIGAGAAYYLMTADEQAERPQISAFRQWLLAQVAPTSPP